MTSRPRLDLVAMGEPLVVFLADRRGPLRLASSFRRSLAGAECNVLRGSVRLGGKAGLIARTGADEFGAYVEEALADAGVETKEVHRDPSRATGIYFRQAAANGTQTSLAYYRAQSAASALEPADIDVDYLSTSRAFLTTGITALLSDTALSSVEFALQSARAAGVTTLFDPNIRPGLWGSADAGQLLVPLLENVDVFLGGEDETRVLFDCDDRVEDLADRVRAAGPSEVVIKRGAQGAGVLTSGGWVEEAARKIAVVDSVGAGDAFNAGYIRFRQEGASPLVATIAGTECGAAVCTGVGDFARFPQADQLTTATSFVARAEDRSILSASHPPGQSSEDGVACD